MLTRGQYARQRYTRSSIRSAREQAVCNYLLQTAAAFPGLTLVLEDSQVGRAAKGSVRYQYHRHSSLRRLPFGYGAREA